ncbi:hypothetical protein VE03_03588 [Pseudogymnoascus sp. 23342-1-I1]|nr:hypothetical protein VE03_03665 [Pseudogymnoascus sp. 23342-1-I1]OBT66529.1 hypothetical protein VE03_03588 [Pseudogymnoascus sp. 23342-1-I1]
MQISKIITTIVATACVSTAVPTAHDDGPTIGKGGNAVCGNGQVISCCNSEKKQNGGSLLDGLLGGNCSPLQIPVLNLVPIPVNKACGNNQAACCTGDQNGLVNLQCNNINVL